MYVDIECFMIGLLCIQFFHNNFIGEIERERESIKQLCICCERIFYSILFSLTEFKLPKLDKFFLSLNKTVYLGQGLVNITLRDEQTFSSFYIVKEHERDDFVLTMPTILSSKEKEE